MLHNWRGEMLRSADNGAGSGGTPAGSGGEGDGGTPKPELTFDAWYGGADEQVKALVEGHVSGLKTALATERQGRSELSKQIKDLAAKAEKGSELEKQLTEASAKLEAAEKRASFAEDAIRPEVGCTNVKAAYALAIAENLFDSRGRADWNAIKTAAPELFRRAGAGSADGGAGTGQGPKLDMNSIIRRAAGRG